MAGRKDKNIIDYFPHYCTSGKTLFILENKFGLKGYAVWFKTLELLGNTENHYIDLRDETDLLFLVSKLKITEQELNDIYNLLSKLDAIDNYLWSKKIIFSSNFINNISDAYKRRSNKCMQKCDLCIHLFNKCMQNCDLCIQKSTKESKVNYSKVKDSKIENFSFDDKCKIFIKMFNEVTGKNHRKFCKKGEDQFKKRLKEDYTSDDFKKAIINCFNDKYHKENNYTHLTPEFITRLDKLEKFLNIKKINNNSYIPGDIDNYKQATYNNYKK